MSFLRAALSRVAALRGLVQDAGAVGSFLLVHRAIPREAKEETMTEIHDMTLLIDALAALITALAELIAAIRRPP